jgi:hypothetical protein
MGPPLSKTLDAHKNSEPQPPLHSNPPNPITYLGRDGKQYVAIVAQEKVVAFRPP